MDMGGSGTRASPRNETWGLCTCFCTIKPPEQRFLRFERLVESISYAAATPGMVSSPARLTSFSVVRPRHMGNRTYRRHGRTFGPNGFSSIDITEIIIHRADEPDTHSRARNCRKLVLSESFMPMANPPHLDSALRACMRQDCFAPEHIRDARVIRVLALL